MTWSNYQEAVFDFIKNDTQHGMVNAVAGSGKSTTGVEALERSYADNLGLKLKFLAFNKHIEVDINNKLAERLLPNWASTYNSFGNGILRQHDYRGRFVLANKTNLICASKNVPFKLRSTLTRLASLCKNLLIRNPDLQELEDLIIDFDIDIPKDLRDKFNKLAPSIIGLTQTERSIYDFDDQKFMPIVDNLDIPKFDLLMVDEFQDSCSVEMELIRRSNSRVCVFGDPWQAIYSFKGTSAGAMGIFKQKYNAVELPLSICYRCPVEVVKEAQKIVAHIESAPNAAQGEVKTIKHSEFLDLVKNKRDTLVLCRVTADLVSSVVKLLALGIPAYILGKDFKEVLIGVINSVTENTNLQIGEFSTKLKDYITKKTDYFDELGNVDKVTYWNDIWASLETFSEECSNSNDVINKISDYIKDSQVSGSVCHMTIHKSKGLEGAKDEAVCIIRPDKIPHPRASNREEEMRLKYVAITRSRGQLYYVENP